MTEAQGSTINNLKDALRLTRFLWNHPKDLGASTPAEVAEIVAHAGEKLDPELESADFWQHLQKWAASAQQLKTQHPNDPEVERTHVARGAAGAMICPIWYQTTKSAQPLAAGAADTAVSATPPASGWHAAIFALLRQSSDSAGADNPQIGEMLWALARSLSDQGKTDPLPEKVVALVRRLYPA